MKVLGLVASPRKLGNSEILAKEMLGSLPEHVEKSLIRLTDLVIKPCKACYACLPEDKGCVLEDDLEFLLAQIKCADAVIIATPCYFLGTHTMLKQISDRLICILQQSKDFAGKKCVVAVTYGVSGWEGYAREAAVNFARFMHLEVAGSMLVQAASPGEVITPEILSEARTLAQKLLADKAMAEEQPAYACTFCGSTLLQLVPQGGVRCPMCGAKGKLSGAAETLGIAFDAPEHYRFSKEGMAEHARKLETIKAQYVARHRELNQVRKPYQQYDWWVRPEPRE